MSTPSFAVGSMAGRWGRRGCGTTLACRSTPKKKKLGMLNVVSSDWQELTAEDLRLLETVGDMIGIAIERARLFEQSAELGAVEERNRLAREIHDILGQGQAAVLMQLEAMDRTL